MKNIITSDNKLILFIGNTGNGKTTYMIQTAFNIIKDYKTSKIYHDDIDNSIDLERVSKITGYSKDCISTVYNHRNYNITLENFNERIADIYEDKCIRNNDLYTGDNGELEPTVYILSSISSLIDDNRDSISKICKIKQLARYIRYSAAIIKKANIILMLENQLIDVEVDMTLEDYIHNMPGGLAPMFFSDLVLKFDYHDIDNTQITLVKSVADFNKRIILKLTENGFEKLY